MCCRHGFCRAAWMPAEKVVLPNPESSQSSHTDVRHWPAVLTARASRMAVPDRACLTQLREPSSHWIHGTRRVSSFCGYPAQVPDACGAVAAAGDETCTKMGASGMSAPKMIPTCGQAYVCQTQDLVLWSSDLFGFTSDGTRDVTATGDFYYPCRWAASPVSVDAGACLSSER